MRDDHGRSSLQARWIAAQRLRLERTRPSTPGGDVEAEHRLYRAIAGGMNIPVGRSAALAQRTQVIDAEVAGALGRGTAQVVLLGAGYDGRPLRFGGGAEFLERLSDAEGDGAIHRMKHPLLLDLWAGDARRERSSMEGLGDAQGIPALRRFAELAARQRLLGARTVPETEIIAALEEAGNILDPCPVVPVKRS